MIVEDIASQSGSFFKTRYDWKKTIFGVYVSPGSAESLVMRGGITNYHSIAYFLSNISAKNYKNGLMSIEVIVCCIIIIFWDTVYI